MNQLIPITKANLIRKKIELGHRVSREEFQILPCEERVKIILNSKAKFKNQYPNGKQFGVRRKIYNDYAERMK